jgi:hypothetical protein
MIDILSADTYINSVHTEKGSKATSSEIQNGGSRHFENRESATTFKLIDPATQPMSHETIGLVAPNSRKSKWPQPRFCKSKIGKDLENDLCNNHQI